MPREIYTIPRSFVIFRTPGVVATVPDPPTLRKSHADFLATDLELGEFAKNIPDRKVFFRSSFGIETIDDDSGTIITSHAGLSNLDYATAGHTGFSPDTHNHSGIYVEIGEGGDPIDISEWFELVDEGLSTEYLRVKKPLCGDGEIQPWTDSGQLPPTIWEALPPATTSSMGGFKLWETQFTIVDGVLKIKDSVIAPASHTHDDRYYTESETTTLLSGKADLVAGKVPSTQLPAYVDDVLEYANLAAFPAEGETGKIYVTLDTNLAYRWSGSAYVEISPSLALGETSATAYRGDRGKTSYDHSQTTHDKTFVGLGNVDNTSDANKPISSATQTALNLKAPLNSPAFTGTPTGITAAHVGALASGATAVAAAKLATINFTIEEVSGELVFKYGATVIGKLTSAGYLKMKDEVEPFASMT